MTNEVSVVVPVMTTEEYDAEKELILAASYLAMRDTGQTMIQIAERFGYTTRQGMYSRVRRWKVSGVLDRARTEYSLPKVEEIHHAESAVLSEWPKILLRMVSIAKTGKEHNAIEATRMLYDMIVAPAVATGNYDGSDAMDYAKRAGAFDPSIIISSEMSEALEAGLENKRVISPKLPPANDAG